jgi:hypothetical protein
VGHQRISTCCHSFLPDKKARTGSGLFLFRVTRVFTGIVVRAFVSVMLSVSVCTGVNHTRLCRYPHPRFPQARTFCRRQRGCCAEHRIWGVLSGFQALWRACGDTGEAAQTIITIAHEKSPLRWQRAFGQIRPDLTADGWFCCPDSCGYRRLAGWL